MQSQLYGAAVAVHGSATVGEGRLRDLSSPRSRAWHAVAEGFSPTAHRSD